MTMNGSYRVEFSWNNTITQEQKDYLEENLSDFGISQTQGENPFISPIDFNSIGSSFIFKFSENPLSQEALQEIFDAVASGHPERLLYLALKYNGSDGMAKDAVGQEDAIYAIVLEDAKYRVIGYASKRAGASSATLDKLKAAMYPGNIVYYCLAICYEKALAVKALLAEQVKAIEEINKKIATNNDYLNKANKFYQDFYAKAAQANYGAGGISTTADAYKVGSTTLYSYVNNTCGGSMASFYDTQGFNTEGGRGTSSSCDFSNIDVNEQGRLTDISNAQEAIRMYGDELSTDAQVLNTKLTQITQNYNSFLSIATQLAKSTGEYFKSIAANVR